VRVGAASDQAQTAAHELFSHDLGISHDLLPVGRERRRERFAESNRLGRDHVHERTALNAGEHRFIERLRPFFG
jgi:hypothetical protein